MGPITTYATHVGIQALSSYLSSFAPHWIFMFGGLLGVVLVQLFLWSRTGSLHLAQTVTIPMLIGLGVIGFVPWWIVIVLCIMSVGWLLFSNYGYRSYEEKRPTAQELTEAETGIENVVDMLPLAFTAVLLLRGIKELGQEEDMVNQLIQKTPEELAKQRGMFKAQEDILSRDSHYQEWTRVTKPVAVPVYLSLEDKVSSMLKDTNFAKGQKSFAELKAEHDGLVMLFAGSKVNDTLINVEKTKSATEDIYAKGLSFIEQAVTTSKQVDITNYDTLKMETDELGENIKDKAQDSALYKVLKQTIDKNNNILALVKKNKDHIDELLCQVTLCKDSIGEVRLTIPSLINYTSADDLQKSIAEVNQRVDFAQKLSNEFKAQGL